MSSTSKNITPRNERSDEDIDGYVDKHLDGMAPGFGIGQVAQRQSVRVL